MSSAVWMANYEALDRCLRDQVIVDAIASRVGQVAELLLAYYVCDMCIFIHHSSCCYVDDYLIQKLLVSFYNVLLFVTATHSGEQELL